MQREKCVMDILVREKEMVKEINLMIDEYEYWANVSNVSKENANNHNLHTADFCKANADRAMEKINDKKKVLTSIRSELAYTLKGYLS